MKNFVQEGGTITLTAPYAVASGAGLLVGTIFGVAKSAAANAAPVEASIRGVFDLAKAAGALTQGAKVYWDNAAKNVTATSAGNTLIGAVTQAAAGGDATARVLLSGQIT